MITVVAFTSCLHCHIVYLDFTEVIIAFMLMSGHMPESLLHALLSGLVVFRFNLNLYIHVVNSWPTVLVETCVNCLAY